MKRSTPAQRRKPHRGRTESSPRSVEINLKPGEVLVTNNVILIARQIGVGGGHGVTTTVTCRCTKSEPDKPDCKPVSTPIPGGVNVNCKMSGGCEKCDHTTTTKGVIMV